MRIRPQPAAPALLYDTHAHLDQKVFADDLAELLARAKQSAVSRMLVVGVTAASSRDCVALAAKHEALGAAVGIQPNYVAEAGPDDWDTVVELAKDPEAIAIGETGLDRYWKDTPFDLQQDYFDRHLRLSQAIGLPFIVHMRECEEDIMVMLREARSRGALRGVMHSYTGGVEMAAECVELGMHISFAGMVTFKKSHELREVAKTIPAERILVETDSPYLSPEPVRKIRRNEPAHVRHTAELLANERGEDFEVFAAQTTANAESLFRRLETS